jgi:PAS domain S-box-containing protein
MRRIEAQALLAAIVDSSDDAIISVTLEGLISSWNSSAQRIFGYSAEEAIGQPISILYPPNRIEQEEEYLDRLLRGERIEHTETERLHKSGKRIDISLSMSPVLDASGKIIGASKVARDITGRNLAEAALRDSEERFRSIADNAPVALYIKDLEGRYTLANRLACEALGRPEGVEGLSDHDLLPRDVADRLRERDLEVVSSRRTVESEEVVERDGFHADYFSVKFPLFDSSGKAVGVCGVSSEITQRKRAQEALRESEERFTRFMQHLPGLAWIKDSSGKYVFANESATQAFQVPTAELYGKTDVELFPSQTAEQFQQNDQAAITSGAGIQTVETLKQRDGVMHYSLVNKFPIPGPKGKNSLVGGMAIDITDLKEAEAALHESEDRFRTLASQAPVGIFMSNAAGDTIFVNDSWCAMAGLTSEQARGEGWTTAIHPDDRERVLHQWLQAVDTGVSSDADFRFIRPDGTITWLQGNAVPLHIAGGDLIGYIGTIADITSRKMAEIALAESEERYRFTLEAAQVGSWDWDLRTGVVCLSENLEEIHDRPVGAFGGNFESVLREVYPPDQDNFRESIDAALDSGGAYEFEYRILRKNGTLGWMHVQGKATCDDSGRPTRVVGVCIDITERRRMEEYMRSLAEASVILSGSLDHEATLDAIARLLVPTFGDWCAVELLGDDHKIQHVTVTHADSRKVDLALELRSRFPPLLDSGQPGVARAIRTGKTEVFVDLTDEALRDLCHNDAHCRLLTELGMKSALVVPLMAREKMLGAITLVAATSLHRYSESEIGIIQELALRCALAVDNARLYEDVRRELAERRRAEESLLEAHQLAEAANRSKSAFLANMSHEIRTPMSAIMGYAELLGRQLSDAELLRYVEIIRRNGGFLLEILNDVLDLSRIEAGRLEIERQRFSPHEIFLEVCSLMQVRADEKGLPLVLEFDGQLPESIESDPTRLRQIVINLVSNAIKFTEQGSVNVVVRHVPGVPLLRFDVIDTGIGVSPDQVSRLFEPFTQADTSVTRRYGGSGVGLAICKRLVEMLGGWIEVQSQPERGSTFSVAISTGPLEEVPLIDPQQHAAAEVQNGHATRERLDCRVLIVDDQPEVRYLVQNAIKEFGGETILASNGHEALEAIEHAERTGRTINVVIMDMQMPVMDGYQATSKLRSSGCRAQIIAVTAHAMQGDRERCLDVGCDEYVSKPIDFRKLMTLIRRYAKDQPMRRQNMHSGNGTSTQRHASPASSTKSMRVLLVEDDRQLCKLMRLQLETRGFDVRWAATGAEAVVVADSFHPEVIVLDFGLPDMNGFEALARIKEIPSISQTVCIALSGRNEPEDLERAHAAGFDHFLVKPASLEQLEALFPRTEKSPA